MRTLSIINLEIKEIIDAMDPYWSGKIIGESLGSTRGIIPVKQLNWSFRE